MKEYILTKHAETVIAERGISPVWLDRVVQDPQKIRVDPSDSALSHYMGVIEEYGNRVLRVIINTQGSPYRIISVFFDRKMKGKL